MSEKETVMVMKLLVDLQCSCCYKKVKKILCKFPQIRDQKYDEKENTVTITVVVSCNPEQIRDKLCSKGSKVIKSIEIKKPDTKQQGTVSGKEKKDDPKPEHVIIPIVPTVVGPVNIPITVTPIEPKIAVPTTVGCPPRTCCQECYEGSYGGGPCHHGYECHPYPYPPRPCSCGCGGYGHGHRHGHGHGHGSGNYNYFHIEEYPPSTCCIM